MIFLLARLVQVERVEAVVSAHRPNVGLGDERLTLQPWCLKANLSAQRHSLLSEDCRHAFSKVAASQSEQFLVELYIQVQATCLRERVLHCKRISGSNSDCGQKLISARAPVIYAWGSSADALVCVRAGNQHEAAVLCSV